MHFPIYGKDIKIKFWNGEQLGNLIAFDTETDIAPFTETPNAVIGTAYDGSDSCYVIAPSQFLEFINCQGVLTKFVMHNAPFDMDVVSKVSEKKTGWHKLIENDRIYDTALLYRLLHLATIGYVPFKRSLDMLSEKFCEITLEKNEDIRLHFDQYLDKPVTDIPEDFLVYACKDAVATYHLCNKLLSRIRSTGSTTLLSHNIQLAGSYALNRIYKRGIGFDLDKKEAFLNDLYGRMDKHANILATWGWVRGIKGSKERFENVACGLLGLDLPRTDDGSVSSKSKDLEPYRKHQFIESYITYHELEKQSTFIRDLNDDRVHPRYDVLKNTGRTGCSKPNFQQLPRAGAIRSMFVASPGNTFIITDYSTLELATLAQITYSRYGYSVMMEKINSGEDLHKYYASVLYSIDIEDVTKEQRQSAKAANFGFPGGLGIATFIEFAAGYGLSISELEAKDMRNAWFEAFPEMMEYMNEDEQDEAAWTLTGRKRANASYCARKNTPFQGLAADGAKIALYYLDYEGCKTVGFVHDEVISEVKESEAASLLSQQEKIMIDAMRVVCPDVEIRVESQISKEYCK